MTPQITDSAVARAARTRLKKNDSPNKGLRSGALRKWPINFSYHRREKPGGGNISRTLFEKDVMNMMMSGAKMKRKTTPTYSRKIFPAQSVRLGRRENTAGLRPAVAGREGVFIGVLM
jgi:hypothetical protein